jgi:hypothetical protein
MEAYATAHYWARELTRLDHEVRLMPAKDVKAYVKRDKNDAADAWGGSGVQFLLAADDNCRSTFFESGRGLAGRRGRAGTGGVSATRL